MNSQNEDIITNVHIRHFKLEDLDTVAETLSKNADYIAEYLSDGKLYKAFTIFEYRILIREYIKNADPYEYFGAFYKDKLVGMGVMCPGSAQFGIQLIYWVDQEFQQLGIASKLVQTITESCFQADYWNVEVQTDKSNIGSQRVLQRNGFVHMDSYDCTPAGTKDTGRMLIWYKFNPYRRNPFGPKRKGVSIWNRPLILPK